MAGKEAATINIQPNRSKRSWLRGMLFCILLLSAPIPAFDDGVRETAIPGPDQLAAAISDPDARMDALLTLAAVRHLLDYGRHARLHEVAEYAKRFNDDRAWLDHLVERYDGVPIRSSLFDAASWRLLLELDQHDLSAGQAVSPFGPRTGSLVRQLFDRSSEVSAATVLPEVLSRMESGSTLLWSDVVSSAGQNVALDRLLLELSPDWFEVWMAAEPPPPRNDAPEVGSDVDRIARLSEDFRGIARDALRAGPPVASDLKWLRYELLSAMPDLGWRAQADASYLVALASAVDGLYSGRFLSFTESVLWVSASMLASELPDPAPEEPLDPGGSFVPPPVIELERLPGERLPYRSPLPGLLSDYLPAFSAEFSDRFDGVDPRLNTGIASVFDVAEYLRGDERNADQMASLRFGIADAVAQFVLLVPDLDFYFSQPVRRDISEEVNICISKAASREEDGGNALTREEFDSCFRGMAAMASSRLSSAELSGDPDGPFGTEQMMRELLLPPWQRINYVLGYLLEERVEGCEAPDEELVNPLEWSGLVTVLTWFARQSPLHLEQADYASLIEMLRLQGRGLVSELERQVTCISGADTGIRPPALRVLEEYGETLDDLVEGLRTAELAFRTENLAPGSDIVLSRDGGQPTSWRKEGLEIGPCDSRYICQMDGKLDASQELIALFPEMFLIADQAGMGEIEICYDNVQWVERRSEPVREDDPHVANYFGHFSFDVFGRFIEDGVPKNVFGFNLISEDEYLYLFGPSDESVLEDRCPAERVGERFVTGIGKDRLIRVVPDRLTYLTSARTLPSDLMTQNWNRNLDWQARFVAGQGVRRLEGDVSPDFRSRLDALLESMFKAQQTTLYDALLTPPARSWRGTEDSLYSLLEVLSMRKALVRANVSLFHPHLLVDSDPVRSLLEGRDALIDERGAWRFRRQEEPVSLLTSKALARLEALRLAFNRQPERVRRGGSAGTSVVHAIIRLDALYRDFFEMTEPAPSPVAPEGVRTFEELDG